MHMLQPQHHLHYLSDVSWFSFLSTAFRAAARDVLVWASLCWTTSVPQDDSGTRHRPTAHTWSLADVRQGLWGAEAETEAGAMWTGEDGAVKARLWPPLMVKGGEECPAVEETTSKKNVKTPKSTVWSMSGWWVPSLCLCRDQEPTHHHDNQGRH